LNAAIRQAGVSSREPADSHAQKEQRRFAIDATRSATALLVDDEPDSRNANRGRLENQGYLVTVAESATEGLSRAKQSVPQVIFVHLAGSGHGSVSLIQALRSDDSCRHIPVVVVTNHSDAAVQRSKLRPVQRAGW
jgi:CheY-like chemotaxis protein